MRFQSLDLNLLVALDALLSERNVSAAAQRLNLSQSTLSGALHRLREYFGDPLLLNAGRELRLTARAEALLEPVRAALMQIEATITRPPNFDPATSERHISLIASDFVLEVLVSPALKVFSKSAPRMTFTLHPLDERGPGRLERGEVDLLITHDALADKAHPARILLEEDAVVVACADNSDVGDVLSVEDFFRLPHITVQPGYAPPGSVHFLEEWLRRTQPVRRRIELVAPTFASVSALVVGTGRIGLMHRHQARLHARTVPIRLLEVPLDLPPASQVIQWHRARGNDPAITWVTESLVDLCKALDR
jgi:LysR family nod box-dependent transcriptional activator